MHLTDHSLSPQASTPCIYTEPVSLSQEIDDVDKTITLTYEKPGRHLKIEIVIS